MRGSARLESDPLRHTQYSKSQLSTTIQRIREDIIKIEDPKADALFETTAEVPQGLVTAFEHFETKAEAAWR